MVGDIDSLPARVDGPGFHKWLKIVTAATRDGWCSEVVGIDYSQDITSFRSALGRFFFGARSCEPYGMRH